MQSVYRTKVVKHTVRRSNAESANTFSPIFNGDAFHALSGGGGTATNGITFGNYGGGQPTFTPASGTGAAFDTSNGRPWYYYNGAWN